MVLFKLEAANFLRRLLAVEQLGTKTASHNELLAEFKFCRYYWYQGRWIQNLPERAGDPSNNPA